MSQKLTRSLFILLLASSLTGCSLVPLRSVVNAPQSTIIQTPENFYAQENTESAPNLEQDIQFALVDGIHWVRHFNSKELELLIEQGHANNPNLAITATRVLDSQVLASISSGQRLPNLNTGLTAARSKANVSGNSIIGDNFDLGLSSQWEVDLWGKLRDQNKADVLYVKASQQLYSAAKLSLSANIAKGYFNVLTEIELLRLAEQNTKNIERIEAITVRSFKRGLVNALDVQLARRDLANAKRALLTQQNTSRIAVRNLEVFLGKYPEGNADFTHSLPALPEQLTVGVPAQVLERRPDLQAAALQMLASEKDVQAARNALLPSIVLSASGGTNTADLKNIFDKDFSVWSILGNLSQPLLNRSALKGNLELEKNAQERAKLEYIDLALRAMNEVETTLASENSLRQQVIELPTARDYAKQSSLQAQQQYEKGLVNANTLLSTETQYLNAEQALLQIQNQILQNRVSLYVALGGDNETDLDSRTGSSVSVLNRQPATEITGQASSGGIL
ncbi:MAG: efflux transporter outer membrane subunit [Gammaproteobacteria bacterium]|nr:efflux transporter outer membrane subunit [Gammaproteobacteria bacterium]